MLELFKSASGVVVLTLALGVPMQALDAAEDQTKPAATQSNPAETQSSPADPRAVAEEPTQANGETVIEDRETAPSNGIKTFDALAVRPVTFVSSVFSAGAFVLALPFAALDPAMDVEKTRKNLVDEPFEDTFQRPLGDFNGSAW
jgi:hypothetical protein